MFLLLELLGEYERKTMGVICFCTLRAVSLLNYRMWDVSKRFEFQEKTMSILNHLKTE